MIGSTFLDGSDNQLFGLLVGGKLGFRFHLLNHDCRLMLDIVFNSFKKIFFCFIGGQSRDSFKLLNLTFAERVSLGNAGIQFLLLLIHSGFLLLEYFHLSVQILFLGSYTSFIRLNFSSAFLNLAIKVILCLQVLFFRLQKSFLPCCFSGTDCFLLSLFENILRLLFSSSDGFLVMLFTALFGRMSGNQKDNQSNHGGSNYGNENRSPKGNLAHRSTSNILNFQNAKFNVYIINDLKGNVNHKSSTKIERQRF